MTDSINLEQSSDDELAQRVRELMAEMGPLEESLARLRVQIQQVATEQRRRERSRHLKARLQVRTTVAEGHMPTLLPVAQTAHALVPMELPLTALRFFHDRCTPVGLVC